MTNINLYQTSANGGREKKFTLIDSGFFWSLGLFLFIALLFGGLKLVSKNLETKKTVLAESIALENSGFAGSDLDRIVDFQARMEEAEKSVTSKPDTTGLFSAIEASMAKGVYVNTLSYEKGAQGRASVSIDMASGDFQAVAKQILSFKENPFFSEVSLQEISRGEQGISFELKAGLK